MNCGLLALLEQRAAQCFLHTATGSAAFIILELTTKSAISADRWTVDALRSLLLVSLPECNGTLKLSHCNFVCLPEA